MSGLEYAAARRVPPGVLPALTALCLLTTPAGASSHDVCRVRAEVLAIEPVDHGTPGAFTGVVRIRGAAGGRCAGPGSRRILGRAEDPGALPALEPGTVGVFEVTRTTSATSRGMMDHTWWALQGVEHSLCAVSGRFVSLMVLEDLPPRVLLRVDRSSGPTGSCPDPGRQAGLSLARPDSLDPAWQVPGFALQAVEIAPDAWQVTPLDAARP